MLGDPLDPFLRFRVAHLSEAVFPLSPQVYKLFFCRGWTNIPFLIGHQEPTKTVVIRNGVLQTLVVVDANCLHSLNQNPLAIQVLEEVAFYVPENQLFKRSLASSLTILGEVYRPRDV